MVLLKRWLYRKTDSHIIPGHSSLLAPVAATAHKVRLRRLKQVSLLGFSVSPAGTSCVHMSQQVTQRNKMPWPGYKSLPDSAASGTNVAAKGPREHMLRLLVWLQMGQ